MEQQTKNFSKSSIALILICIFAVGILLYFSVSTLLDNKITELEGKLNPSTAPVFLETNSTTQDTQVFTIKEFNGKIGIYKDGDFQYQIDVYVFTLPDADKKLLRQGINVSSEQELNDVISCYY